MAISKIPLEYLDSDNDFGFSAVHETDLTEPIISEVKTTADDATKQKLLALEKMVMPLLVNLMKNPEKDYIHWPNRVPMIEKQIEKILAITRQ
jgi:hypothetical protein